MIDKETIKQEIQSLLEHMSFSKDLEGVEAHEGATSRFSVRLRGSFREETKEEELEEMPGMRVSAPSMLIGESGNNLSALEYLIKRIIRKKYGEEQKFTLDINDYRMKKLEDLKQDVKAAAKEARLYKKEVPLRSMSSFERRIVHLLLAEYPDIATESIGEEPNRRVIIKPYP